MRKYNFMVLVAILLFVIPLTAVVSASNSPKTSIEGEATTDDSGGAPIDVQADFGNLPLSFIPNVGQSNEKVQFQTHAYGGTVFFTDEEIVLALPAGSKENAKDEEEATEQKIPLAVARLSFEKREGATKIEGSDKLAGIVNYYQGNDRRKWFTGVPTYGEIVYNDLYPGIDLHYNSDQAQLKSTFIVAPRVDPKQIRWRYKGAEEVSVDKSGRLHVLLNMPKEFASSKPPILIEQAPIAWQEKNGEDIPVKIGYTIAGDGSIGFEVGEYDRTKPLILDPTLTYSSYLGGTGIDTATSIDVDSSGQMHLTGMTLSTDFPTDDSQDTPYGLHDVFITKLNSNGSGFIYSTYLGGMHFDYGHSIVVSDDGATLTGGTSSPDFPKLNEFQDYNGNSDAFVTQVDPQGELLNSSYLGGSDLDFGDAITQGQDFIYLTGTTKSSNFLTKGASQRRNGGERDVFVVALSGGGSEPFSLHYSTYLGGNERDEGRSIAVDSNNNVYITGFTESNDFPTANSPIQPNLGGGVCADHPCADAFVTKLSAKGSLVYGTYLGGDDSDAGNDIAIDNDNNIYLTGKTGSENFPIHQPLQHSKNGQNDAFVTKLSPSGQSFVYSTYLGGTNQPVNGESGQGITVDDNGNAYIIGTTNALDFVTVLPLLGHSVNHGADDVFVTMLSSQGQEILFSTYLGGESQDAGRDIVLHNDNELYLVGDTLSDEFPVEDPIDPIRDGHMFDAFMAKISLEPPSTQLAYFYITPNDADEHVAQIAEQSKLVILTKRSPDREFLNGENGLRANGYNGKALQYVVANQIQATSDGLLNNQWVYNDKLWDQVNSNPEWYLYKEDGTRITNGSGSYDYMDPGNLEWQNFVKQRAVEFILDQDGRGDYDFDGIFLDNVDVTWSKIWRHAGGTDTNDVDLYECDFNRKGKRTCEVAYGDSQSYELAVQQFLQAIHDEFENNSDIPSTHPRLLWGNMISDPYTGSSWDPFMPFLDGGMFEGWLPGYESEGGTLSAEERLGGLIQAETLLDDGKEFVAVGQGEQDSLNRQQYALASYLLVVPENNTGQATFRYTEASVYQQWWYYDNYDYRLGEPLGERYQPDPKNLPYSWKRDFQNGYVILDLQSLKHQIVLNTGPSTVRVRVAESNDDAEQNLKTGWMDVTSSDLELVFDQDAERMQTVGLRFQNINIPQGAIISRAYLDFTADEAHSGTTSLTFYGQASDNPAAFTSSSHNISNRSTTSASVTWNNIAPWEVRQTYQTPYLTSIVQEIVDRSNWQNGNAMVFILTGSGTRVAESYDGVPGLAPVLHIEYIEP